MKYDFIDIGCGHFDVSVDQYGLNCRGLLVEPIQEYCDVLPCSETVSVDCCAISNHDGEQEFNASVSTRIEYLPSSLINNPQKLNRYQTRFGKVAGLGTFNNREEWYGMNPIPRVVKTKTLKTLFDEYDVTEIGRLKLDVEGHENVILNQLIELMSKGLHVNIIKFEYNDMSDLNELDVLISKIKEYGYGKRYEVVGWNEDIIMEKL